MPTTDTPIPGAPPIVLTDVIPRPALKRPHCRARSSTAPTSRASAPTHDGVIRLFNTGAERMLGYAAAEVVDKITPADVSDPQELSARASALSLEFAVAIAPAFDAMAFNAARGVEDSYELTYIRKDGSRFPAVVSVTALRDAQDAIIGYLLISTDNDDPPAVRRDVAQDRGAAERHLQQRQLLEHRHRRERRHPDLQRRRRADAGLHRRRGDEQDHAGRHLRSAGSHCPRQGAQRRAGDADYARASRRWCSRRRAGSRTSTS